MDYIIEFSGSCIINAKTEEDAQQIFWENCTMEFESCDIGCASLSIKEVSEYV